MAGNNSNGKPGGLGVVGIIVAIIVALWLIGSVLGGGSSSSSSSSSQSSSGEQRCWYCKKVIVNSEGRPIHLINGKCEYCGHKN